MSPVPEPARGSRLRRTSAALVVLFARQHRFVLPVLAPVLLVGGLALPPVAGAACLVLLLALLGWLAVLSWPLLRPPARFLRVAVWVLLVVAVVARLR